MLKRLWIAAVLALAGAGAALAQPQNPSFNLVNRSDNTINEVYATSAGMANWGRDRLGDNSIPPGQSYPIRLPADGNCVYDVKVVYANGGTDERRGLNTCTLESVVFPAGRGGGNAGRGNTQQSASDPSFRLVNGSRSKINEVYASAAGDDSWGQDRLGDGTVAAGATRVIRLPTGQCIYDVRVVFANGEATEKRRLNLCTITNLRVP
jgi:hypothetical protein